MRVTIQGNEKGQEKEIVYRLLDRYDRSTKTSSMARTTGYTCTAAACMLLEGRFSAKGVIAPEHLGKEESCFQYIMAYLEERGVIYDKEEREAC
jgi:saccharopine dehydrogenase-like NADP-dependent oxidoreductase